MRRRAFFSFDHFLAAWNYARITTLPKAPAGDRSCQRSMPAQEHIPRKRECIQETATSLFGSNQSPTGTPRQQCLEQPGTSQYNNFEKRVTFIFVTPIGPETLSETTNPDPIVPKINNWRPQKHFIPKCDFAKTLQKPMDFRAFKNMHREIQIFIALSETHVFERVSWFQHAIFTHLPIGVTKINGTFFLECAAAPFFPSTIFSRLGIMLE